VTPLVAIRSDGKTAKRLGMLSDALEGSEPFDVPLKIAKNIDALGRSSRSVDLSFGLDILGDYLKAFGLSTVGLDSAFQGAKEISFSFVGVQRLYIDALALGKSMRGRKLDIASNPALAVFGNPNSKTDFFVIDSALTSPNISIKVDTVRNADFKFDVPAIQDTLGNVKAGVAVKSATGRDLSVTGETPLTFAFSVLRFNIQKSKVLGIDPGENLPNFAFADAEALPSRVLLTDSPVMVSLE
jgi:hypothetical protein